MKSCNCSEESPHCLLLVNEIVGTHRTAEGLASEAGPIISIPMSGQENAAFDRLLEKFTPLIRHIARRILGSSHLIELDDLVQEIFLHLIKVDGRGFTKLSQWSGKGPFCNWLGMVAGRCCFSILRGLKEFSQPADEFDIEDARTGLPEDNLVNTERAKRIVENVSTFRVDEQIVFWNYYVNELSYEDLARLMGINERTVRRYREKVAEAIQGCQG